MNLITNNFSERKLAIHNNEKGQSAIEFILTFAFALGVTFLFVNLALNQTNGYVAHYVNFMAARSYLVHDVGSNNFQTNINQAKVEADKVFTDFKLETIGLDGVKEIITSEQGSGLFSGAIFKFERKLSSLPLVGGGATAQFYSEALLGKEPTRITCSRMICAAMTGNPSTCESDQKTMDITLYDNGC